LQFAQIPGLQRRKSRIAGCRRHGAFGNDKGEWLDRSHTADASAQASSPPQGDKRPAKRRQISGGSRNVGRRAVRQRRLDSSSCDLQK
jgi:hypothetical protein